MYIGGVILAERIIKKAVDRRLRQISTNDSNLRIILYGILYQKHLMHLSSGGVKLGSVHGYSSKLVPHMRPQTKCVRLALNVWIFLDATSIAKHAVEASKCEDSSALALNQELEAF